LSVKTRKIRDRYKTFASNITFITSNHNHSSKPVSFFLIYSGIKNNIHRNITDPSIMSHTGNNELKIGSKPRRWVENTDDNVD
jgi:hypothetical protein